MLNLGRIFKVENFSTVQTRSVMTEFCKRIDRREYAYDTLMLVDAFTIVLLEKEVFVSLLIQREKPQDAKEDICWGHSVIVATDFRENIADFVYRFDLKKCSVVSASFDAGKKNIQKIESNDFDFVQGFDQIIGFNAQINCDAYGRTTKFFFVGARFTAKPLGNNTCQKCYSRSWWEKQLELRKT